MKEALINAKTLPEAYHAALVTLHDSGEIVGCEDYDTTCKELSMTMVIDEPLAEPMISKFIPCGHRELEQYLLEMLDGILDWAVEVGKEPYTYHRRFTHYWDCSEHGYFGYTNQIGLVVKMLKDNPNSRRAVIDIRDNAEDCNSPNPACLQHVQFFIRGNKLHCKVLMRSNDAVKATFMNAFALIMLQKRIAAELGINVGSYTHRANSFHVYQRDWDALIGFYKRFAEDPNSCVACYEGDWKEEMESYIPKITEEMERLKHENGC